MISKAASLLVALLIWAPAPVVSQDDPGLFSKIQRSVLREEPRWELERNFLNGGRVSLLWKHGAEEVSVTIRTFASPEEAAEEFRRSVNAVPIPAAAGLDGTVPGLGDESRLWARYTLSGRSTIHFRKGSVHVQMSAPSLGIVGRFAQLIADEVPAAQQGHAPDPRPRGLSSSAASAGG